MAAGADSSLGAAGAAAACAAARCLGCLGHLLHPLRLPAYCRHTRCSLARASAAATCVVRVGGLLDLAAPQAAGSCSGGRTPHACAAHSLGSRCRIQLHHSLQGAASPSLGSRTLLTAFASAWLLLHPTSSSSFPLPPPPPSSQPFSVRHEAALGPCSNRCLMLLLSCHP
jgi:hypothetical protein